MSLSLDEVGKKLNSKNASAIQADASNLADLDKVYSTIKDQKGRLDILFASAGIAEFVPLDLVTEKHFDFIFHLNVKGVLFTIQKALPIVSDSGSIIINESAASIKAAPGQSVYCASKMAVRSFARCWTVDEKERRIRVNVVRPGPIETAAFEVEAEKNLAVSKTKDVVLMSRVVGPKEVATVVVVLAS